MNLEAIEKRIRRLDELSLEIGRDISDWRKGEDPLLYLERRALVSALHDTLSAVEEARVRLVRAEIRIKAEARESLEG